MVVAARFPPPTDLMISGTDRTMSTLYSSLRCGCTRQRHSPCTALLPLAWRPAGYDLRATSGTEVDPRNPVIPMSISMSDDYQCHYDASPYDQTEPIRDREGAMGVDMRTYLYVMASEISAANPKQIQKTYLLRSAVYSSSQTHATHPILRASIIRC